MMPTSAAEWDQNVALFSEQLDGQIAAWRGIAAAGSDEQTTVAAGIKVWSTRPQIEAAALLTIAIRRLALLPDSEKVERDRIRLRDQGNDLLNIRGMLSPQGWPRRVPDDVEMVPNVAPAIRWLLDEVERLTELVAARDAAGLPDWDDGTCGDCADGKCHGGDPDDCGCARHAASVTE